MLVLTREPSQEIVVEHAGELLRLVVTTCRRGRVRLGFEGPRSFEVHRSEVYSAIAAEVAAAASNEKEPVSAPC